MVFDTVCKSGLDDWFEVEHKDGGEDFCKDFSGHDSTVVLDAGEVSLFGEDFEEVDVPIVSELLGAPEGVDGVDDDVERGIGGGEALPD